MAHQNADLGREGASRPIANAIHEKATNAVSTMSSSAEGTCPSQPTAMGKMNPASTAAGDPWCLQRDATTAADIIAIATTEGHLAKGKGKSPHQRAGRATIQ